MEQLRIARRPDESRRDESLQVDSSDTHMSHIIQGQLPAAGLIIAVDRTPSFRAPAFFLGTACHYGDRVLVCKRVGLNNESHVDKTILD